MKNQNDGLRASAILVRLNISRFVGNRVDKKICAEIESKNGAHDAGVYIKKLFDTGVLKALGTIVNEARAEHRRLTLSWNDDGIRILPMAAFDEYTKTFRRLRVMFDKEVKNIVKNYDSTIAQQRSRLGKLFKQSDFPTKDKIADLFKFDTGFMPIPEAKDFRVDLPEKQLSQLRGQLNSEVAALFEQAIREPFQRLVDEINKIVIKLSKKETIFRDKLFYNFSELVDLLPKLNLSNDKNLNQACDELKAMLADFDPNEVRQSSKKRRERVVQLKNVGQVLESYFKRKA